MKSERANPIRQCIVTGEQAEKDQLIRFVVGPENRVVPDVSAKLPGRGIWVVCQGDILEQAVKKKLFSRAAKQQVIVDDDLVAKVTDLLKSRAVQAVSLARKAGEVVCGFEKIKQSLHTGDITAIIHADDAGEDGIRKLAVAEIPVFYLNRDDMARIMGRENMAHIALLNGPAASHSIKELQRFTGFMSKTSL